MSRTDGEYGLIGPYRVVGRLGSGSSGVVHRAIHRRTGAVAAVKTVHAVRLEALAALRREIDALRRLRHPGVVRILEQGETGGHPWYAMELIDGRPLLEYIPTPHGQPTTLEPLLTLFHRICGALAYLHGEGVVHRDLKPGNVRVRPDGRPVLVDFGLVSRTPDRSRDALDAGLEAPGTPGYMAPEQLRGEPVDARADLFALGVLLYVVLTGRLPFRHLETVLDPAAKPAPPSTWRTDLPLELDHLTLSLLEKDPRARPGYAGDVARSLERLGAAPAAPLRGETPARAYLYRSGLAGRDEPLEALGRLLGERLSAGSSALVLIGAESGAGKTRLLVELARRANRGRMRVITGECLPPPGGSDGELEGASLHPLRDLFQAVADRRRDPGDPAAARRLELAWPVLSPWLPGDNSPSSRPSDPSPSSRPSGPSPSSRPPDPSPSSRSPDPSPNPLPVAGRGLRNETSGFPVREPVGEGRDTQNATSPYGITGHRVQSEPSSDDGQDAPPLTGEGSGERSFQEGSAERSLLHGSGERSLLHGSGERSFQEGSAERSHQDGSGERSFQEGSGERPLPRDVQGPLPTAPQRGRGLAGSGPEERNHVGSAPAPVELPPRDARLRLFNALLEALEVLAGDGAVLLLIDDLQWADELTLAFLEHLARASSRPGLRLAVVAACRTDSALRRLERLRAARGVRELELPRLSEPAVGTMVCEMLALPGAPGPFVSSLARQSAGNPFFVSEYLHAAVEAGLLYRDLEGGWQVRGPGDGAILPVPDSLGVVLERRLSGLSRRDAAAVEAASVLGRVLERDVLAELLRSAEAGIDAALGELHRRHILEAREDGGLGFVHDALRERAYQRLGPRRRKTLHAAAARALTARIEGAPALAASLAQHWDLAGQPLEAAPWYLRAARFAVSRYATGEAGRLYEAFLRVAPPSSAEGVTARIELARDVLYFQGRPQDAEAALRRALEAARALEAVPQEALALQCLARVLRLTGKLEEAVAAGSGALERFRALGDAREEAVTQSNLANFYLDQEDFPAARAACEAALAMHRRHGNRRFEGITLGSLAGVLFNEGDLEGARAMCEQALEIHREAANRLAEGRDLGNLALIHRAAGRLEPATAAASRALLIAREIGYRKDEAVVLGLLAELERDRGRPAAARERSAAALDIHREIGNRPGEGAALVLLSESCGALGELEEAVRTAEEGVSILRAVGYRPELLRGLLQLEALERQAGAPVSRRRALLEEALELARSLDASEQVVRCEASLNQLEAHDST